MPKIIHQSNDKLFKKSMADPRVAKEFLTTHLPKEILDSIDLSSLAVENNSFIDKEYKAYETDVLFSVDIAHESAFIYILCEMQTEIDDHMCLRLWIYLLRILDRFRKNHPKKPFPLVYPLVVYSGNKPWAASRTLFELFGEKSEDAKSIFESPHQLIELQKFSDNDLRKRQWSGLMEYVLKHRKVQKAQAFFDYLFSWLYEVELNHGTDFGKDMLEYVIDDIHISEEIKLFLEKAEQHLADKLRGEAMTLAEQFKRQGIQIGMEQGIERGIDKSKQQIALKMLSEGFNKLLVAKITDLSIHEIEELLETA